MVRRRYKRDVCLPAMRGALAVALLLFGWPTHLRAQSFSELEGRGFEIVARECASCHAIARSDISPYPKAPPFRILGRRYPVESLAEQLAEGIIVGHADMPQLKFRPEEVGALIAYLKYVQEPQR